MKKICTASTLMCVMLFSLAVEVSAADHTISYRNAKTIGMGGARIAGGFGYNGFVDNPALLSRVNIIRFSLLPINLTLNKNIIDIGKFINDNQGNFEKFDDLSDEEKNAFLDDVQEHDGKWSRLNLSPMVDLAISYLGQSFGLAVFGTSDVGIKVDRGIYEPRVWGEGKVYGAVVLGYARPLTILYPGLKVGINLKYLERRKASLFQIKASDLGNIQDTTEPILNEVKEEKHHSFAVDVGTLWDIPFIDSEIGATIQSIGDGRGSSFDIGIAKRMLSDHLILLVDYIDFFDNNKENVFNKLHLGAEYKYEVLAFRAGLNSGYPALGFGFNFRVFDIDAAYYFEELGNAPGIYDDERFVVQFKLGW